MTTYIPDPADGTFPYSTWYLTFVDPGATAYVAPSESRIDSVFFLKPIQDDMALMQKQAYQAAQSVPTGKTFTVQSGFSMVVVDNYDIDGDLILDGDMAII